MKDQSEALCERCEGQAAELVLDRTLQLNDKERQFQELWSECQRCQGAYCQEILCSNRDCPIFYRREKIRNEVNTVQDDLARLHLDWF